MTPADAQRIAELIESYSDLGLSGTDASLIVLAERLGACRCAQEVREFMPDRPWGTDRARRPISRLGDRSHMCLGPNAGRRLRRCLQSAR